MGRVRLNIGIEYTRAGNLCQQAGAIKMRARNLSISKTRKMIGVKVCSVTEGWRGFHCRFIGIDGER
jgi:hypothetical protein